MNVFQVQERTLFAPSVCDFILELRCKSVECYGRLCVKTRVSLLSYYTETVRTIYDTMYRHQVPGVYSKMRFAADAPIVLLY